MKCNIITSLQQSHHNAKVTAVLYNKKLLLYSSYFIGLTSSVMYYFLTILGATTNGS